MREGLRLAVTLALAAFVAVSVAVADPPEQDRALALGSRIRCPVCQGESIADSPSGYARNMMALVRERIDDGYSDEQIVDELLASFSGSQLLDPEVSVETIALWAVPALALGGGIWLAIAQRKARARVETP